MRIKVELNFEPIHRLLRDVDADIDRLPLSAIALVGALVAVQTGLPQWLHAHLMHRLGQRADLSEVSPAAEAVMRLKIFSEYEGMDFAQREIAQQQVLLKSIGMLGPTRIAALFLKALGEHLATAAATLHQPTLQNYMEG